MSELVLNAVTKSYAGVKRLDVARLAFQTGERVAVSGLNGSGKSTLLKVLAGVVAPTSGQLVWRTGSRPSMGYLPQAGGFAEDVSLNDNFRVRRTLYGSLVDPAPLLKRLNFVDDYIDRPMKTLSGAFQRMGALVLALSSEPDCLILDEPLAGLDRINRERVITILNEYGATLNLLVVCEPVTSTDYAHDRELLVGESRVSEVPVEHGAAGQNRPEQGANVE